jgi:co-chaperonin GroES (HSP10)
MRAIVIAVGADAYRQDNQSWLRRLLHPYRPRCKPGDKVMVAQHSGAVVHGPKDGELYRMVNDQDVFVRITEEAEKPLYPY